MIYTALGDSITYGQEASSREKAFTRLALNALQSYDRSVKGYVLARPGWSSTDLLDAVRSRGTPMIRHAAVVSVWIGGVDLANAALQSLRNAQPIQDQQLEASYKRNVSAILAQIQKESNARIVCCTQYNPFPGSPLAAQWISRLNQMTQQIARSYGATLAPAHLWFEGQQAALLSGYRNGKIEDALSVSPPIHPNDRGHRVIAKALTTYLIRTK